MKVIEIVKVFDIPFNSSLLLLLFQKIWKVNFIHFFFETIFFFFCLCSFIYFILILIFKHKFNKQIKQINNRYSSLKYNNVKQELECKPMNNSFNTRLYSNRSMKWITFGKNHKYIQFKLLFKSKVMFIFLFYLFYFIFFVFSYYFVDISKKNKIKFKTK